MSSKKTFEVGDYVFAKMRGYCPWPAKIFRIIPGKNHYHRIHFYGTTQIADLTAKALFEYNRENIKKFATEKQMQRKQFAKGMAEIRRAVRGNDCAPRPFRYVVAPPAVPPDQSETVEGDSDNESFVEKEVDGVPVLHVKHVTADGCLVEPYVD